MKGFVTLAAVAAVVVGAGFAHSARAGGSGKVRICHLNRSGSPAMQVGTQHYFANGTEYFHRQTAVYHFGRQIEVAADAVASHEAHGDSSVFMPLAAHHRALFQSWDENDETQSYDYRPAVDFYGSYSNDYTNGDVGNANCWVVVNTNE